MVQCLKTSHQSREDSRYQSWGVCAVVSGFLAPGLGEFKNWMHQTQPMLGSACLVLPVPSGWCCRLHRRAEPLKQHGICPVCDGIKMPTRESKSLLCGTQSTALQMERRMKITVDSCRIVFPRVCFLGRFFVQLPCTLHSYTVDDSTTSKNVLLKTATECVNCRDLIPSFFLFIVDWKKGGDKCWSVH